jgi:hypothetical protein
MSRHIPHNNPDGRPIHPDCQRVRSEVVPCTCPSKWFFWNGEQSDIERRIATIERLDGRSRAGLENNNDETALLDELIELDGETLVDGFWKESEFLRCIAGKDFRAK